MPSRCRVITSWSASTGSRVLGSPAAPLALVRLRTDLRGFPVDRLPAAPAPVHARSLSLQVRSLRDLHSPSETPLSRLDRRRPSSPAVHLECPSTSAPVRVHSQVALPLPFGPTLPHAESRSVLVVSHHLDDLLLAQTPELVASRSRPWGPPRFHRRRPSSPHRLSPLRVWLGRPGVCRATRFTPSEGFPSPVAASCHRAAPSCDVASLHQDRCPPVVHRLVSASFRAVL